MNEHFIIEGMYTNERIMVCFALMKYFEIKSKQDDMKELCTFLWLIGRETQIKSKWIPRDIIEIWVIFVVELKMWCQHYSLFSQQPDIWRVSLPNTL